MNDTLSMKALRIAAPYLSKFRDRILVVKMGGAILEDDRALASATEQIAMLWQVGIKVVVVHGGGQSVDALCARLGIETHKVAGRRVTSPEALTAVEMTLTGTVSNRILGAFRRAGVPAVSVSGLDAGLLVSTQRAPVKIDGQAVDFGKVGDISETHPQILFDLMASGYVPLVAPLSATAEGEPLNTNADTAACEIALAVQALKLVFLVDVPGICRDITKPETLVMYATWTQVEDLIADGTITGGMLPKVESAHKALLGGVQAVHLVNGRDPEGLLTELFTNEGSGTMIDIPKS